MLLLILNLHSLKNSLRLKAELNCHFKICNLTHYHYVTQPIINLVNSFDHLADYASGNPKVLDF